MSAEYFPRWQRPPTDVEERRFEQCLLANQVDRVKMLSSTKRLILLHASFRNKDRLVSWGWTTAPTITPPKKVVMPVTRVSRAAPGSRVVLGAIFRYCGKLDDACVDENERQVSPNV